MIKNGILTLLFAFVPGAGQMYQGYMKRGLSLISLFCAGYILACIFNPLAAVMLVVWMYSFFDTLNLRAQLIAGAAPKDDYILHLDFYDSKMKRTLSESHKLLGWGLITLGCLTFYQEVLMTTLGDIVWRWGQSSVFFRALYLMLDFLPEIVVCVALVVCGVWLVRGPRGAKRAAAESGGRSLLSEFREYRADAAPQPAAAPENPDGCMPAVAAQPAEAQAPACAAPEAPEAAPEAPDQPEKPEKTEPPVQPAADDPNDFDMEVFISGSGEKAED